MFGQIKHFNFQPLSAFNRKLYIGAKFKSKQKYFLNSLDILVFRCDSIIDRVDVGIFTDT